MDLDLSLGPPRSGRRQPTLDLGFDLALGSPVATPTSAASTSSSSSGEEAGASISAAAPMAEPPPFSCTRSCTSLADPTGHPRTGPGDGGDLAREYSPYSLSYQPLGPSYAPIPPPPGAGAAASLGHALLDPASYLRVFPADQGSDRGFPLHLPYDPLPPTGAAAAAAAYEGSSGAGGSLPHVPYSAPSYAPLSVIPEEHEEAAYGQRPIFLRSPDAFMRGDHGSSSRARLLDAAEIHVRRMFAMRRRPWEGGFFRAPSPYGDERPRSAPAMGDLDHAEAEVPRKDKAGDEGVADESLEEDDEDEDASAVNFECNICLELAKEPVVTPCGHLFCWPCLYQWLHLHCNFNECPVCKGEVTEAQITPIYGRGSSHSRTEDEEDEELGLKIPPRPRGRRSESWRQRLQRPISRRFGLEVTSSWRRLFGEEVHIGSMMDVRGDPSLQQIIGVENTSIGRGSTRVGDNMENGYFSMGHPLSWRNVSSFSQNGGNMNPLLRGGFNEIWAQVSSNSLDRSGSLAAAAVGPSRISARTDGNANITGGSAPLLSTRNLGGSVLRPPVVSSRTVGQASASSTMAVIQGGDVGVAEAAAEPNTAGSSRNPRLRGRGSGSLYADGCPMHACKGRRLN